jgi:hypothetical protein
MGLAPQVQAVAKSRRLITVIRLQVPTKSPAEGSSNLQFVDLSRPHSRESILDGTQTKAEIASVVSDGDGEPSSYMIDWIELSAVRIVIPTNPSFNISWVLCQSWVLHSVLVGLH